MRYKPTITGTLLMIILMTCCQSAHASVVISEEMGWRNMLTRLAPQVPSASKWTKSVISDCVERSPMDSHLDLSLVKSRAYSMVLSPISNSKNNISFSANSVIEEVEAFEIYDRWRSIIYEAYNFQANDEMMGWNGTINNESDNIGVYTYYVVCMAVSCKELKYAGNVTLLK